MHWSRFNLAETFPHVAVDDDLEAEFTARDWRLKLAWNPKTCVWEVVRLRRQYSAHADAMRPHPITGRDRRYWLVRRMGGRHPSRRDLYELQRSDSLNMTESEARRSLEDQQRRDSSAAEGRLNEATKHVAQELWKVYGLDRASLGWMPAGARA